MFESPDKPQDDADSWAHAAAAVLQEIVNESQSSESSESVTYRN